MGQYSILVVDDEEYVLKSIIRLLREEGYNVLTTVDCREALNIMAKNKPDLIISDYRMPQMSGIELISRAKQILPQTKCIIITGYPYQQKESADISAEGCIDVFIEKPWQNEEFKTIIRELLKGKKISNEN